MKRLKKLKSNKFLKTTWLNKFCARKVAHRIMISEAVRYEAGWENGKAYFITKESMAHWVLTQAGYYVTIAMLMDLYPNELYDKYNPESVKKGK